MFHSNEVNEEAVLFANWAYKLLHDTIVPMRYQIAVSPLSWLLNLPYAVEILSQTAVDEITWTEVSTTCIYYKDWETHTIRRSFTCQFHPELMADIRDIGKRDGPRYAGVKGQRRSAPVGAPALSRHAGVVRALPGCRLKIAPELPAGQQTSQIEYRSVVAS